MPRHSETHWDFVNGRVHHASLARIEVEPDDYPRLLKHYRQIVGGFLAIGRAYVILDLGGIRGGGMSEAPQ